MLVYHWLPDFPEESHQSFRFLSPQLREIAAHRLARDRDDGKYTPFTWQACTKELQDLKLYVFSCLFFINATTATACGIFLAIVLEHDMNHSTENMILLSTPPVFYALIPVSLSSIMADRYQQRGAIIGFNTVCTIIGVSMLGLSDAAAARYVGAIVAYGGIFSNWVSNYAYMFSNAVGHWKKIVFACASVVMTGLGGIAGSYLFDTSEAPFFATAAWIIITLQMIILVLVLAMSCWFLYANHRADQGDVLLDGVEGFRYSY